MSIQQSGVAKLTLYENKNFNYSIDNADSINANTITNSGDVFEYNTNDNDIEYQQNVPTAENNNVLFEHVLNLEINNLTIENYNQLQRLNSSIYGWIPEIEFMDGTRKVIEVPFWITIREFNSQQTHTFFVELRPRINTVEKLQNVTL